MAKRYTTNQQEYLKQTRRIRKALSALRRKGYDVSELAQKYTTDLPKRITNKLIQNLQSIKPKHLKQEANYIGYTPKKNVPLSTTPFEYQAETIQYTPPITQILPSIETALAPIEEVIFEPTPETITEEPTEYIPEIETEYESYPEEYDEPFIPLPPIPENKEPEIETIETDTEILYVDTSTGEIVDRVTRIDQSDTIDLSEYAIESLRDLASHFSPQVSENINRIIDKMIQEKGKQAVADAFTKTTQERPSLLQMLSSAYTRYKGMAILISDLCEELEIDDMSREIMRDVVTRESMSDMDEYI